MPFFKSFLFIPSSLHYTSLKWHTWVPFLLPSSQHKSSLWCLDRIPFEWWRTKHQMQVFTQCLKYLPAPWLHHSFNISSKTYTIKESLPAATAYSLSSSNILHSLLGLLLPSPSSSSCPCYSPSFVGKEVFSAVSVFFNLSWENPSSCSLSTLSTLGKSLRVASALMVVVIRVVRFQG